MNLATIPANWEAVDATPEQRALMDAMIRQRERFLEELEQRSDEVVFVALYPAAAYV
jgi:hypothetical protein